jgi:hypothetical protein
MAKLPRVPQKIFASGAPTAEVGQIGSLAAGTPTTTKDVSIIQNLAQYLQGLYAITANRSEPPRIEDINGLYYLITHQLAYLMQSGIPEWDAETAYYAQTSFVNFGGIIYKAILDNSNSQPDTNPLDWEVLLNASNIAIGTLPAGRLPGFTGDVTSSVGSNDLAIAANTILAKLLTVDGTGSGLDADKVRGITPGARGLQYLAGANPVALANLILSDIKTVDGTGSGLDADLLQGVNGENFVFGDNSTVTVSFTESSNDLNDPPQRTCYLRVSTNTVNTPLAGNAVVQNLYRSAGEIIQIWTRTTATVAMYWRRISGGTFGDWRKVYDDLNDSEIARIPQVASGRGQFIRVTSSGVNYSLPSGGTWAYMIRTMYVNTASSGGRHAVQDGPGDSSGNIYSGVAAGGTALTNSFNYDPTPPSGTVPRTAGFAWRIS